jgi:hypothetical protein
MGNGPLELVSLDPGGTTGWASYSADMLFVDNVKAEYFRERFNSGEIGPDEHHRRLFEFLEMKRTHSFVIICESFQYRPNMDSAELISNEYIGVVKKFHQDFEVPVVWQTKSYGRGFFDDAKLKKLQVFNRGMGHANDAMGHLLQYMVFGPFDRVDILKGLK